MGNSIEAFKKELANLNIGRASPGLIENIIVKLPSGSQPIKALGGVVVKNARQLTVNVFDRSVSVKLTKIYCLAYLIHW
jgi:ribosome recycling factor